MYGLFNLLNISYKKSMNLKIEASYTSNIGKIRTNNEDNIYFNGEKMPMYNNGINDVIKTEIETSKPSCFGVFDGMGGESNGERASFLAIEQFEEEVKKILYEMPEQFLLRACYNMNKRICQEQENEKCYMGTTIALLYFFMDYTYICNVGDSRIYKITDGKLIQLSEDHVAKLDAINGNSKPPLTQNLGIPEEEMQIEPYIGKCKCNIGDKFLICSDGLTDMVSNEEILHIIDQNKTTKEIVEDLLEKALENGGKDNTTIIVCEVK